MNRTILINMLCIMIAVPVLISGGNAMNANPSNQEEATLGGGCFWCLEPVFEQLKGVLDVRPGYAGGTLPNPTYKQVTTGRTGHAEVIRIVFDSSKISFKEILDVFFAIHDPTTLNRQGADTGTQYRSIILYHNEDQKRTAEKVIREAGDRYRNPVVTEVVPFEAFYEAENYHQDYYNNNPGQPYCRLVIAPKIDKFQKLFPEKIEEK